MNLEELADIWNENSKTPPSIEVNEQLLKEASYRKIRISLREIKWTSVIEIVVTYVWLKFLAAFLLAHYATPRFSLPALILLFIAICGLILEVCKLYFSTTINHQHSIVDAQKKLERLRLLEVIDNNSLLLFIPLFLAPFLIVFAKGIIGFDLYLLGISTQTIILGTAGTFIVALIMVILLNLFPNKDIRRSLNFIKELRRIEDNKLNN